MSDKLPVWSLTDFYDSIESESIRADLQKCSDEALKLQQKYEGKIASLSANEASNVIVCYEQIIILLGKISSHADLCFAADTSNPEFAQHSQNMREAINAVQSNLVFIELELASISEVQYLQMLK